MPPNQIARGRVAPPDPSPVGELVEGGIGVTRAAGSPGLLQITLQKQIPTGDDQLPALVESVLHSTRERFVVVLQVHQEGVAVLLDVGAAERRISLISNPSSDRKEEDRQESEDNRNHLQVKERKPA